MADDDEMKSPMVRAMATTLHNRDIDGTDLMQMLRALVQAGFHINDIARYWDELKSTMRERTPQ